MKAWACIFLLIGFSEITQAAEALGLSYAELGDRIREHNLSFKATDAEAEAVRRRIGTIDRTFLPTVGIEAGAAEQREVNGMGDTAPFWKVEVQSNLYRRGRDELAVKLRDFQSRIKTLDAQAQFRSELFKVRADYIQLHHIRRDLDLIEESLGAFDGLRSSILKKAAAGLMSRVSVQVLDIENEDLLREQLSLRSEEAEVEDRMAIALGSTPDQGIHLLTRLEDIKEPEAAGRDEDSLSLLPEIKRHSIQIESNQAELQAKQELWVPEISAFATYLGYRLDESRTIRSLPERELAFGLRFSIDLEDRIKHRSDLQAKPFENAASSAQRDQDLRLMEHRIHEYLRELSTQRRIKENLDQQIAKTSGLIRKLRAEFERGVASHAEVAEAIRSLYRLKRKGIDCSRSYYLALVSLETLTSPATDQREGKSKVSIRSSTQFDG